MSCFAELSPQLLLIGNALRTGLILGGTSYLQDLLTADERLRAVAGASARQPRSVKRQGWLTNDVFALQNLMESFLDFKPLTPQLSSIGIPTMILNGEFDFLTPRALHETLRLEIPNSALVIIPTRLSRLHPGKAGVDGRPALQVRRGRSAGNGRATGVWIAPENAGGELVPFPTGYDHLRAIPAQRDAAMSDIFWSPRSDRSRAAPSADARCRVPVVCSWRDGAAVCVRPALEARVRLANRIEFAVLSRIRNRFAVAPRHVVGARSRFGLYGCIVGSGLAAKANRRNRGPPWRWWSISQRARMPCMLAYGPRHCCRQVNAGSIRARLAEIEFESSRLMQAQIMLLKGPNLVPFRSAVNTAVESRHEQVRKLWTEALEGVGIATRRSDNGVES